jgi:imidazolonepropionase-like amidohydrolase/ABC-type multidrug transport system permease subunit
MNLRLTMRDKTTLFFTYLFPLMFFFLFGQMSAARGAASLQPIGIVFTMGVLGSGFFGAGMRAVMDREQNILRRFKVAPIGPGPILVSSMVTGLLQTVPLMAAVLVLGHRIYQTPWPTQPISLFVFISVGVLAFRALGGMLAAVVNSMQESQILIQLLYVPMLLLSGATIPIAIMPQWLQIVAQFLPATHLSSGLTSILRGRETIFDNLSALGALALTTVLGTFLGIKLFRWEKEEKMRPSAKLWLIAVLAPFIAMGVWQAHAKTNIVRAKIANRDERRSRTILIRGARLFIGDGAVWEHSGVLIKDGKIAHIYNVAIPDPKTLGAEAIDAAGKTLMPGLIDVHVHLGAPGGFYQDPSAYQNVDAAIDRELAAYLYSGVTAVKSVGDSLDQMLKHRASIASGERLGAELFAVGPMFTAPGGHGTEYAKYVPESIRATLEQQLVRLPATPQEARMQVAELKTRGVDGIKAILEAGGGQTLFNRMDVNILLAVASAARQANLPIVVHTGAARDVSDALDAQVDGIEHGSLVDAIPVALFARMKAAGTTYDPTLAVFEALQALSNGNEEPLNRSLVQQVAPPNLLIQTQAFMATPQMAQSRENLRAYGIRLDQALKNLKAAHNAGVLLVTGTDSGNPLLIHGPAIHRELQLWVRAGIPPAAALQAATYNAAQLLRTGNRIGKVAEGYEANLLLVDGNPLEDISATERISAVFFKGEQVSRADLFDQD